jgi:hypothetical protein
MTNGPAQKGHPTKIRRKHPSQEIGGHPNGLSTAAPDTMPTHMRRMLIPSLLAATIGLFAAASWNDPSGSAIAAALDTVSPGATPSTPKATASSTPSKSQALAFARAVNLGTADVPGFKISHEHHSSTLNKQTESQLAQCLGRSSKHKGLVEVDSKNYDRETSSSDVSASSEVTVLQSPALAAHPLALIKSAHTRACVSRYFNLLISGLKTPGAKVGKATLTTGTPSAPGTVGSFGWRLTTTITVVKSGAQVPFYLDILGFVQGPAEVTLLTSGLPQPFPASGELGLFSLLVKRAQAQSI